MFLPLSVPATEQFMEKAVSYQQFSENPSIIDDPNLVVKIGSKYVLLLLFIWTERLTYTSFFFFFFCKYVSYPLPVDVFKNEGVHNSFLCHLL